MQNRIALQRHRLAVPHLTLARTTTNLKHRANQAARRTQYGRPSCACLNQAIRTAWQQPRRFGFACACGRKIRACARRVVSSPAQPSPRRSCTCGGPADLQLPSLPPSVVRASLLSNDGLLAPNRRNATRPNHYRPSQPNPAQPNPCHPIPSHPIPIPIRSSQGSCRDQEAPAAWSPSPRVPAGWSLPGDPEIQLQADPGQVPPRAPDHIQSVPTYLRKYPASHEVRPSSGFRPDTRASRLRDSPGLASSELACLPFLPARLPARTTSLCSLHTRTRSISSSYPALP